jgi:mRNA-degrading endonuclease toxin of MazEF toxin-antitoxin module
MIRVLGIGLFSALLYHPTKTGYYGEGWRERLSPLHATVDRWLLPFSEQVEKHRDALRAAGLRPVQIWVPDTRPKGFRAACRRQSLLLRNDPQEMDRLPIAGELRQTPLFRVTVEPSPENGLRKPTQVMVDKAHTIPREKIRGTVGRLEQDAMLAVNRALALFLGFV